MNILLVCSKYLPEYSGAGFRAHNLYKRLKALKPEITASVLCGSETENDCRKYVYEDVTVNRIACKQYPVLDTGFIRRWQNICNFHNENAETVKFLSGLPCKPDLIHVFGQNYVTVTAIDHAIKNKIPLLIELVTDLKTPYSYIPFPFKYWMSSKPNKAFIFVCISEKLRRVCLDHGLQEENIWCRPNPVDDRKFKPVSMDRKSALRRKLTKFGDQDKVVAYIAKYRPSKNQSFLVEMLKNLPDGFKLFIKGPLVKDGPLADRDNSYFRTVRDLAGKLNLEDRVQVEEGFCENVDEYYQMADVYAFPSTQEGLGTPVLESIACGVPVVAHRIPGVTDTFILDGENGFVSSAADPVDFASRIKAAASFGLETMSCESRKLLEKCSTSRLDSQYIKIIEGLAG